MPKKLTVEIEDDLHRRLKRVSVEKDLSMRSIIEGLLRSWLPKQEETDGRVPGRHRDRGDA